MMDFLITFSLIFPWLLLIAAVLYFGIKWLRKHPIVHQPYSYVPSQTPTWQSTTITTTTDPKPETPKFADLEIDERDWDDKYPGETQPDAYAGEAHVRVYRVYRSMDRKEWAECDPVLTERAACNYASYIKRNNPTEYVRVEDPDGLILFYE